MSVGTLGSAAVGSLVGSLKVMLGLGLGGAVGMGTGVVGLRGGGSVAWAKMSASW
jgi:hypothetical protein